ncbi:hypothetical protein AB0L06_40895 [Spirillospora sp. NPDC052269]
MKITDTTRRAVLDALETQDWAAFEPERDLLPPPPSRSSRSPPAAA